VTTLSVVATLSLATGWVVGTRRGRRTAREGREDADTADRDERDEAAADDAR
jgi:hypothetical protein